MFFALNCYFRPSTSSTLNTHADHAAVSSYTETSFVVTTYETEVCTHRKHVTAVLYCTNSTLLYSTLFFSTLLSTLLYPTLLYSTLLYSTLLYSTLLCTTLLYSTLLYSTLYFILPYSSLPSSPLLYSALLHFTRLDSNLPLYYCTLLCYYMLLWHLSDGPPQLNSRFYAITIK